MSLTRAYEEVIDFIAAGTSPDRVAAFRPSEAAKQRVGELVQREKTTGLTADESSELEHYLQLEHLMRLAKARARPHLSPP
jgi:O-succinylbenzoate synthase